MNELNQLIGTWKLLSFRILFDDGDVEYPMGPDAVGFILYSAAGYMSGQLMQTGRPKFSAVRTSVAERGIGTPEEIVAAFNGYFSYCCRVEADPLQRKLTHSVIACHLPDWEGRKLERFWKFEDGGNRLTLTSAPLVINGRAATNRLAFQREPETFISLETARHDGVPS